MSHSWVFKLAVPRPCSSQSSGRIHDLKLLRLLTNAWLFGVQGGATSEDPGSTRLTIKRWEADDSLEFPDTVDGLLAQVGSVHHCVLYIKFRGEDLLKHQHGKMHTNTHEWQEKGHPYHLQYQLLYSISI